MSTERHLTREHLAAVRKGWVMREMNAILARVRMNRDGQPGPAQKRRLAELVEEKRQIESGDEAADAASIRYTTCTCPDGEHRDPKAATRSHALLTDADIIARHTGRHVVPVGDIRTEVAA